MSYPCEDTVGGGPRHIGAILEDLLATHQKTVESAPYLPANAASRGISCFRTVGARMRSSGLAGIEEQPETL